MVPGVTAGAPAPLSRAAIIAIGSELLTPLRVDTNSLHITEQLNRLGIDVVAKVVVGDDRAELAHVLAAARQRVDLIVCTGGLGPTDDDVTRDAVADVTGCPLREDPAITDRLRARFAARFAGPMPEINRRQAMVPEGAVVLENSRGSAPGLWIDDGARVVLLLPGPPRELQPMLAALVSGPLAARAAGVSLVRRILKIAGRIESKTEEELQPVYAKWAAAPVRIEATILAALGQLELHLSARAGTRETSEAALERAAEDVMAVLGADVFSRDNESLETVVGQLLAARSLRIAVAESCTGGLITSRLTDVIGSSRYVERSVVTYSNAAKTDLLGVEEELLQAHGAVSDPVARAMAEGVRTRAGVDVGVGVTGIAGPGGGTDAKPVGTVVIAVATDEGTHSRTFRFLGEREQVKFQASQAALDMVRRLLL
ncbi:MAG: competence/damage-inducible protein A [Vicinamibacterales bacterium]